MKWIKCFDLQNVTTNLLAALVSARAQPLSSRPQRVSPASRIAEPRCAQRSNIFERASVPHEMMAPALCRIASRMRERITLCRPNTIRLYVLYVCLAAPAAIPDGSVHASRRPTRHQLQHSPSTPPMTGCRGAPNDPPRHRRRIPNNSPAPPSIAEK